MLIVVDSEGEPIQEWSAFVIDEEKRVICNVFHAHVAYPYREDGDWFARKHIHGLCLRYLSQYGLSDENELLYRFSHWLQPYTSLGIYANAPTKESHFLSRPVTDVSMLPWGERQNTASHKTAVRMKLYHVPICNVSCLAHNAVTYHCKRVFLNDGDRAKMAFGHHCSLYDCVEIFHWLQAEK